MELNNKEPIDEGDHKTESWLKKLQGNILRGHGRDRSLCLFFSFGDRTPGSADNVAKNRELIGRLRQFVVSAHNQHQQTVAYRKTRTPGQPFGCLLLSATGYRRLGFDADAVFGDANELFRAGLRGSGTRFHDPVVAAWEPGYQQPIDGMLLIADDDGDRLLAKGYRAGGFIVSGHTLRLIEHGRALRNDRQDGVDHFGFLDGISQPRFLKDDFIIDENGTRLTRDGQPVDRWDPFESLDRVLVPDPLVDDRDAFGSFMVFRKLEQDVRGFRARERELAEALGLPEHEQDKAGALIIGRFRNGTPLTVTGNARAHPPANNDFTYGDDPSGHRCPVHAHIRKVNPRGSTTHPQGERERRIVRRSITYGGDSSAYGIDQLHHQAPSGGVGLLFMCYQSSIERQFAFIQGQWSNQIKFPRPLAGVDPLIGQSPLASMVRPGWSSIYDAPADTRFSFDGYVTMKGGEFLFAPSVTFLDRF